MSAMVWAGASSVTARALGPRQRHSWYPAPDTFTELAMAI